MANNYFSFKQFIIQQGKSTFKVGTDGVLLGASANISGMKKILDIGSGTGLIAIMLAQRSNAEIVAIEPDHDSFLQAKENISLCKWSSRIKVEHTDLQEYDPGEEKYDLIITNPPYFTDSLKCQDPRKTAARHNDTLSSVELLTGVARLLDDNGIFQLIMPYVEGMVFIAEANSYKLFCNRLLKIRPLPTADVRRLIMTFSRDRIKSTESFLTIEHGKRHEFTDEYINLTKDFYLKF
ncbi:MAG TPA: methyltransferase [Bacteroidales bacterium]|nr:methyltransferase [Bacteroidales bacterium]